MSDITIKEVLPAAEVTAAEPSESDAIILTKNGEHLLSCETPIITTQLVVFLTDNAEIIDHKEEILAQYGCVDKEGGVFAIVPAYIRSVDLQKMNRLGNMYAVICHNIIPHCNGDSLDTATAYCRDHDKTKLFVVEKLFKDLFNDPKAEPLKKRIMEEPLAITDGVTKGDFSEIFIPTRRTEDEKDIAFVKINACVYFNGGTCDPWLVQILSKDSTHEFGNLEEAIIKDPELSQMVSAYYGSKKLYKIQNEKYKIVTKSKQDGQNVNCIYHYGDKVNDIKTLLESSLTAKGAKVMLPLYLAEFLMHQCVYNHFLKSIYTPAKDAKENAAVLANPKASIDDKVHTPVLQYNKIEAIMDYADFRKKMKAKVDALLKTDGKNLKQFFQSNSTLNVVFYNYYLVKAAPTSTDWPVIDNYDWSRLIADIFTSGSDRVDMAKFHNILAANISEVTGLPREEAVALFNDYQKIKLLNARAYKELEKILGVSIDVLEVQNRVCDGEPLIDAGFYPLVLPNKYNDLFGETIFLPFFYNPMLQMLIVSPHLITDFITSIVKPVNKVNVMQSHKYGTGVFEKVYMELTADYDSILKSGREHSRHECIEGILTSEQYKVLNTMFYLGFKAIELFDRMFEASVVKRDLLIAAAAEKYTEFKDIDNLPPLALQNNNDRTSTVLTLDDKTLKAAVKELSQRTKGDASGLIKYETDPALKAASIVASVQPKKKHKARTIDGMTVEICDEEADFSYGGEQIDIDVVNYQINKQLEKRILQEALSSTGDLRMFMCDFYKDIFKNQSFINRRAELLRELQEVERQIIAQKDIIAASQDTTIDTSNVEDNMAKLIAATGHTTTDRLTKLFRTLLSFREVKALHVDKYKGWMTLDLHPIRVFNEDSGFYHVLEDVSLSFRIDLKHNNPIHSVNPGNLRWHFTDVRNVDSDLISQYNERDYWNDGAFIWKYTSPFPVIHSNMRGWVCLGDLEARLYSVIDQGNVPMLARLMIQYAQSYNRVDYWGRRIIRFALQPFDSFKDLIYTACLGVGASESYREYLSGLKAVNIDGRTTAVFPTGESLVRSINISKYEDSKDELAYVFEQLNHEENSMFNVIPFRCTPTETPGFLKKYKVYMPESRSGTYCSIADGEICESYSKLKSSLKYSCLKPSVSKKLARMKKKDMLYVDSLFGKNEDLLNLISEVPEDIRQAHYSIDVPYTETDPMKYAMLALCGGRLKFGSYDRAEIPVESFQFSDTYQEYGRRAANVSSRVTIRDIVSDYPDFKIAITFIYGLIDSELLHVAVTFIIPKSFNGDVINFIKEYRDEILAVVPFIDLVIEED